MIKRCRSRLSFLIVFLFFSLPKTFGGTEIVIFKQADGDIYREIEKGFRGALEGEKELFTEIIVRNAKNSLPKARKIMEDLRRDYKSFFLFSIGIIPTYVAYEFLANRMQNPTLFSLVFSPERLGELPKNFAGILMRANPKELLSEFLKNFSVGEIDVLFSPATEPAAQDIRKAGEELGVKIRPIMVEEDKDAVSFFSSHEIRPIWILPDVTVVNPDTIPLIINKSQRVPIIVFSKRLVELGCLFGYQIDFGKLGQKAGEIAIKILKGEIDIRKKKYFYPPVKYIKREDLTRR